MAGRHNGKSVSSFDGMVTEEGKGSRTRGCGASWDGEITFDGGAFGALNRIAMRAPELSRAVVVPHRDCMVAADQATATVPAATILAWSSFLASEWSGFWSGSKFKVLGMEFDRRPILASRRHRSRQDSPTVREGQRGT